MRRLALALKEAALREHEFTGQRQPKRLPRVGTAAQQTAEADHEPQVADRDQQQLERAASDGNRRSPRRYRRRPRLTIRAAKTRR